MDINFNFGEHYYDGTGSFWMNVLIAFIGAFFGLLFALLINRCVENGEKKKVKSLKIKIDKDRLSYLALILKSTVDTSRKQIIHFTDLAKKVEENPLEIHMPNFIASHDVWRLRNLDSIELFDSYVSLFKEQENNTKEYKNIFGQGDYIFEKMADALKQNERHRNFQHKDELFVRDCIDEIYTKIGLRTKNIEFKFGNNPTHIEEFNYLREFENIYSEFSESFADFKGIKEKYLKPLHDTILHQIADINFSDYIFELTKKALNRLLNVEYNSLEFAKDMKNLEIETKKAIDYLDNQRMKIEEKIEL